MKRRYGKSQRRAELVARVKATQDTCYLCGEPVNKSLPAGHPCSAEVDDIIPVSHGGNPNDIKNLALAHKSCNLKKSDKSLTYFRETQRLEVSRQW
jgi:5-methylcytosine-specific restriction endonuclease McrA